MAKSINKFIVKLSDLSNFKPKLTVTVSVVKEKANTYLIKIMHPNYKLDETGKKKIYDIVHQEEYVSTKPPMEAISEAMKAGKELLDRPDILEVARNTQYVEQLFIPQGRRGKVKLKTKDSDEAVAERATEKEAADDLADEDLGELPEMDLSDEDVVVDDDMAIDEEPVEETADEDDEDEKPAKKAKKAPKKADKKVKEVKSKEKKEKPVTPKAKPAKKKVAKKVDPKKKAAAKNKKSKK